MEKIKVAGIPRLFKRKESLLIACPGCGHGLVQRLICEVVEEMGQENNTVIGWGIGCSGAAGLGPLDLNVIQTPHGRACDGATAIKRLFPNLLVFNVQGDGDCFAIGTEGTIHAAARGEKFTVIMVNNTVYGTTGGQLAPTTVMGQKTSTTPQGRDPSMGYPLHTAELLAGIKGVVYSARGAVNNPANFRRTKQYITKAFQKQMDKVGFSFVEILSPCPPNWGLTPVESLKWLEEKVIAEFPLGEFKNIDVIE